MGPLGPSVASGTVGIVEEEQGSRTGKRGRVEMDIATRIAAGQVLECPQSISKEYSHDEIGKAAMKRLANANVSKEDVKKCNEWVLYADSHLIAINKPPGLPVQGGKGIHRALDSFLPIFREIMETSEEQNNKYVHVERPSAERVLDFDEGFESKREKFVHNLSVSDRLLLEGGTTDDHIFEVPRLVHRLDADTSGVMLLGRSRIATHRLTHMFQKRAYEKMYWSVVFGRPVPNEGVIKIPLHPIGLDGKISSTDRQISAKTAYRVLSDRSDGLASWVLFQPKSGRKHQIRRHAVEGLKCPIFGDSRYGTDIIQENPNKMKQLHDLLDIVHPSLQLHARKIRFVHPFFPQKLITITAPPPAHMMRTLKKLKFVKSDEKI